MAPAEVILQPRIRPFRLATLLVALRLAGCDFDLLAAPRIVVDQRRMSQTASAYLLPISIQASTHAEPLATVA